LNEIVTSGSCINDIVFSNTLPGTVNLPLPEHETEMKFSLPLLTNIVDSFSNDSFVMSFGENRTAPAFFDPVDNVHGNNKFFLIAPLK